MSGARRLEMIRHHPDLSLACQCALLGISRSLTCPPKTDPVINS